MSRTCVHWNEDADPAGDTIREKRTQPALLPRMGAVIAAVGIMAEAKKIRESKRS